MKKLLLVILAIFIAFSLCSCAFYSDEELEEYTRDSYENGYTDGYDKGYSEGYEEGSSVLSKSSDDYSDETYDRAYGGGGDMVYYTDTGSKYHSEGCHYLSYSSHSCTRAEAEDMGLEPCSVCNP